MNIQNEIRRLNSMLLPQLKVELERVSGEAARSNNRTFLIKRIVHNKQVLEYGGLSERARAQAVELGRDRDLRVRPSQDVHAAVEQGLSPEAANASKHVIGDLRRCRAEDAPPVGTVIRRQYHGATIELVVTAEGFVYAGTVYRSLSAAAKAITGTAWNGRLFFGLTTRKSR